MNVVSDIVSSGQISRRNNRYHLATAPLDVLLKSTLATGVFIFFRNESSFVSRTKKAILKQTKEKTRNKINIFFRLEREKDTTTTDWMPAK